MQTFVRDLRYSLRVLAKNPGFTAVAVLTLALGIGANTAIFSVVNAVLLKPLPYKDSDRLAVVWEQNPERGWYRNIVSAANFVDWRKQNHAFTGMAAADPQTVFNLTGAGQPEEVWGEVATTNLFSLLGVQPFLGRDFTPDEDKPGGPHVVILSYGLWQRRYGGDRGLVGKQISLNNESYTVVGIMPAGFYFPPFWRELFKVDLWVAGLDLSQPGRTWHNDIAIARLKPGATLPQAQAEMDTIARGIHQQFPEDKGWDVGLVDMREQAVGDTRPALLVLLCAVGFVLLIACANVANLMLVRSAAREKEIAIRMALGANRRVLIRQFLTDSLLLAILGGALGLLLASWGVGILVAFSPKGALGLGGVGGIENVAINTHVLAFTFVLTLVTGIVFGLAPALAATRADLNPSLKEGGRGSSEGSGRRRLRDFLAASEIALALVLLVGAGLMIRTLVLLGHVNLGFNPQNVMTMRVSLLGPQYKDPRRQSEFFAHLLERVKALPGVQWASVSRGLPVEGWDGQGFVTEEHPSPPPNEEPDANYVVIGPDYFRVMGIPLLQGRFFTEHDAQGATPVAIVNEKLASRNWPGENPIGKRLRISGGDWPWLTVVGVVGNVKTQWPSDMPFQEIYVPFTQYPWVLAPRHLVVRAVSDPTTSVTAIRREVAALDSDLPVSDVRPLTLLVGEAVAQQRFSMVLLGAFAGLALVLASVGIYGVISYSVAQRTREMGIRVALGAQAGDVLRLVVGRGFILTLAGVAAGLAAALALTRFLGSLLYGVRATDPWTYIVVALILAAVSSLASYIPARRATKVDPIVALRYE